MSALSLTTYSKFPAVQPLPVLDPLTGYPCPVSRHPDDIAAFLHRTNVQRQMIYRGPFPASYAALHPERVKKLPVPVEISQPLPPWWVYSPDTLSWIRRGLWRLMKCFFPRRIVG